jgi:coiled-coil domain-containing protein 55
MSAGFSGFSIAKKPAAKPAGKSNLAASSTFSSTKEASKPIDKHEELRRVTEAAKVELQKEDLKAIESALEEDPTLFDYSEYYDEMHSKMQSKKKPVTGNAKYGYGITLSSSGTSKASTDATPQSRYIDSLLLKARERESERELVMERQRHKENQKYEEMFGSTESFVTPEYQAKLEEDQRKREELERRDRQEAGISSMANFHTNLRRATLGGDSDALSANEHSSSSQNRQSHEFHPSNDDKLDHSHKSDSKNVEDEAESNDDYDVSHPSEPPSIPRQSLIALTTRKPRRHTDEMIDAAKQRYQLRKEQRSLQT